MRCAISWDLYASGHGIEFLLINQTEKQSVYQRAYLPIQLTTIKEISNLLQMSSQLLKQILKDRKIKSGLSGISFNPDLFSCFLKLLTLLTQPGTLKVSGSALSLALRARVKSHAQNFFCTQKYRFVKEMWKKSFLALNSGSSVSNGIYQKGKDDELNRCIFFKCEKPIR